MKTHVLSALLSAFVLSADAAADLHHGSAWLQGPFGPAFGIAQLDLDDETGTVSVIVDLEGVTGSVLGGRLVGTAGETLCALAAAPGAPETWFGTAGIAPSAVQAVKLGLTRVVIDTRAQPQGELEGFVSTQHVNYSYPFSPGQVSPGQTGTAHGTGYVGINALGELGFSGQLRDLQGTITAIELWRGGWYGQSGTLELAITQIGFPTPTLVTFYAFLPTPSPELARDVRDGLCFVIARTSLFPQGELRGQIRPPTLGDFYCTGRQSSMSVWGARAELDGSPLVANDDLRLTATPLPPGKVVLPIVGFGTGHVFNPGGMGGILCVAGSGVLRLGKYAGLASAQGTYSADLQLASLSIGGVPLSLPGQRVNFQVWYRDPQGPTTTNLSSAVSIVLR